MIEAISREHFITIVTIVGICIIGNENVEVEGKKVWTEQDEARRIQQVVGYISINLFHLSL